MELTSRCNERCVHCYIPHEQKHADLDWELGANVLDQLRDMGTMSVTFSGGEPLLHPRFADFIKKARANDFIINLLTNGTLITKDMGLFLHEMNVAMVQVSIYSMDPVIHDAVTTSAGSLSRTLAGVEQLLDANAPVQISCPVMKQNSAAYRDVALWCKERGLKVMSDFILMAKSNFDTSNLEERLDIEETRALIRDIMEVEEEYRELLEIEAKTVAPEVCESEPVCGVGVDNACICADGSVYPCSGFRGLILGDAKQTSLEEIWRTSTGLKKLRGITRSAFPQCRSCGAEKYCAMCLVRNFNESNGDPFKVNEHYCRVAWTTKELADEKSRKESGYV
jgi:radical SAM protein with 4Fe4S-binding SPASM domain